MSVQVSFCATLVDEWARAGLRHAVVSPGSRSTPLALALDAEPRMKVHVHLDERSAGFMALGIGKATGVPAVVLTTSGTAAVELHPAVVEASHGGVPLLACTANRPPELHDIGAAQTVDQAHLYGRAVRWYAAPGVADAATSSSWRSLAARAVLEATGPRPGPVHLDLAFRDPLLGPPGDLPDGRPGGAPWHRRSRSAAPDPVAVADVAAVLRCDRGVIVAGAGAGAPDAVHALAVATGWPVLADPLSGCRVPGPTTVAAADALLRSPSFAASHRPEVVLQLGQAPASKVVAQWVASSGAAHVVIAGDDTWRDPDRSAAFVLGSGATAWCTALTAELKQAPAGWLASWTSAEAQAQAAIAGTLGGQMGMTEPLVARTLLAAATEGSTVVVSSSMPVRDLEWYGEPRTGVRVLSNRGANGIDGVVSTAAGVALATSGPVTVLIGDVAFLHDANALLGLVDGGADLTVVVVDNCGGGIFSFLPQAHALPAGAFERLFATPPAVDLLGLARAHGLDAEEAATTDELTAAVTACGPRVVVVRTADRQENVRVHDDLHAAVVAALGATSQS